jgi:hypothetical protein
MILHDWFGTHVADHQASHWESGHFVSRCTRCGREMIKPSGAQWQLRKMGGKNGTG